MINCRVVGVKDLNVFTNFFDNFTFIIVFVIACFVQFIATSYGFYLFGTVQLSPLNFISSILWGSSTLAVSLLVKMTPVQWVDQLPTQIDE